MAQIKINKLPVLPDYADGDEFPIVDTSDTTDDPAGSSRKGNILDFLDAQFTPNKDLYDERVIRDFIVETGENATAGRALELLNTGNVRNGFNLKNIASLGSAASITTSSAQPRRGVIALTPTKFVITWADSTNSNRPSARIADITDVDNGVTLGSTAEAVTTASTMLKTFRVDDSRFIMFYTHNADVHPQCIVGSVSGNTITFGTELEIFSSAGASNDATAIEEYTNEVYLFGFSDAGNSGYGTTRAITISGTTATRSTSTLVFENNDTPSISFTPLNSTQVMMAYIVESDPSQWQNRAAAVQITGSGAGATMTLVGQTAIDVHGGTFYDIIRVIGLIAPQQSEPGIFVYSYRLASSGTQWDTKFFTFASSTITAGGASSIVTNTASLNMLAIKDLRFILHYQDPNASITNIWTFRPMEIDPFTSPSTIDAGTIQTIDSDETADVQLISPERIVVVFKLDGSNFIHYTVGTFRDAGQTLIFRNSIQIAAGDSTPVTISKMRIDNRFIVAYYSGTNLDVNVGEFRENIGFALNTASGGQTVTSIIDGVNDQVTGLVQTNTAYVDEDGIVTTPDLPSADKIQQIGIAIDATHVLLSYDRKS